MKTASLDGWTRCPSSHARELLATGKTQQAVADEIGWSIDKVKKYCALEKISPVAWSKVTEFVNYGTFAKESSGTIKVTDGTFNENLLRNILPLTEIHQLAIVSEASRQLADETGRSAATIRTAIQREETATASLTQLSGTDKHRPFASSKRPEPIGFEIRVGNPHFFSSTLAQGHQ